MRFGNLPMKMENNNNLTLHKHVGLVHCSSKLGLFQRKLLNCFLYIAKNSEQRSDGFYTISYRELLDLLNLKNNDYAYIKENITGMFKDLIELNLLGEVAPESDEKVWEIQAWFSKVRSDGAIIYYQFSDVIQSMVYNPCSYAHINLKIQQKFTSKYALFLYENCVRYKNVKKTPRFTCDFFRKILGVKAGQYPDWKEFKRRILNPALNQINKYSDINIDYALTRRGGVVASIQFLISKNKDYKAEISPIHTPSCETSKNLINKKQDPKQPQIGLAQTIAKGWHSFSKEVKEHILNEIDMVINHDILKQQILNMLEEGAYKQKTSIFEAFISYFTLMRLPDLNNQAAVKVKFS